MEKEIVNRVAQSKLLTFDLEELYPSGLRITFDIKEWLHEGLILREKEFRQYADQKDWTQFQNAYVALYCSVDAIIPAWAYMLLSSKLEPFAKKVIIGDLQQLETLLYESIIEELDLNIFKDKSVIIKGCSEKPVPLNAYGMAATKIQQVAKSVMYGEACSAVPIFKRK